jgi:hypothetical protein
MDLYAALLNLIADQYEQQKDAHSEIILQQNPGNSGGFCKNINFVAGRIYKIILPEPLRDPEAFILLFSYDEGGRTQYCYEPRQKNIFLDEYENDLNSFFLEFKIDVASGSFFTNCL